MAIASAAPAAKPQGTKPQGSPGDWIRSDDYPPEALKLGAEGRSRFRLDIDPAGTVTACTITESSGSAVLDDASCNLLRSRAHFSPALDRKGVAIAAFFTSSVNWRIPVEMVSVLILDRTPRPVCQVQDGDVMQILPDASCAPLVQKLRERNGTLPVTVEVSRASLAQSGHPVEPPKQGGFVTTVGYPADALRNHWEGTAGFTLDLDVSGHVIGCRITSSSGYRSLDDATCSQMTNRAKFSPARNANGQPIASSYSSRIAWKIPN